MQRVPAVVATHGGLGWQRAADGGALGQAEQAAAKSIVQVRAGHTRGFALGQAGQGAGDGGCDAAGGAAGPAGECHGAIVLDVGRAGLVGLVEK